MNGPSRIGRLILEGPFRGHGVTIRLGQARRFRARPRSRTEIRAGPSCEELQDAYYSSRVHGGTSTERFFLLMRRRKGLLRRAYVLGSAAAWWRQRRSVCPGPLSGARRLTRSCCRKDCSGSSACASGGSPASGSACADDGLGRGALSVRHVAGRWYGLGALVLGDLLPAPMWFPDVACRPPRTAATR